MAQTYDSYYNDYHKNNELQLNLKYKKKYRKLKRIVKNTVFVSLNIYIIYIFLPAILLRKYIISHLINLPTDII